MSELHDLAVKAAEAMMLVESFGMMNTYGLTPSERAKQQLEFEEAKAALHHAERAYRKMIKKDY